MLCFGLAPSNHAVTITLLGTDSTYRAQRVLARLEFHEG